MELDDTDKGILYLLQQDARGITTQEMADRVGVSASTVRNRIERLEEGDVVRGYHPDIDYDKAGLQLYVEIICSAPNPDRAKLAEAAESVAGVVAIREVLNGKENVQTDAVGTDSNDVARITDEISGIGLDVVNTKIIKDTHLQPFNHFGQHLVEGKRDDRRTIGRRRRHGHPRSGDGHLPGHLRQRDRRADGRRRPGDGRRRGDGPHRSRTALRGRRSAGPRRDLQRRRRDATATAPSSSPTMTAG